MYLFSKDVDWLGACREDDAAAWRASRVRNSCQWLRARIHAPGAAREPCGNFNYGSFVRSFF